MQTSVTPPGEKASRRQEKSPGGDDVPLLLRPLVHFVARIQARLETKFLVGFLGISVLMLALGIVSLFAVNRMDSQVDSLTTFEDQASRAQEMLYSVTAQSHFRTMSLLTGEPVWDEKIASAKETFLLLLAETESTAGEAGSEIFEDLRGVNQRFAEAGVRVAELQMSGDLEGALQAHIQSEHEISHELEDLLNEFIGDIEIEVAGEIDNFSGVRRFITVALAIFSGMSLAGAIALGAIISWTVIVPVRRIDSALDTLASGDFTTRIEVPNRDEFGKLSENVNRASEQLEMLYGRLETVNQDLQAKVDEQVAMLEQASQLRRYLSPQVADSIIAGDSGLGATRRAELSIVFADIRGFTAMSERFEPEDVGTSLNRFLTDMTEVVFEYEGTLDKYVGDAIMVFFNDPLPQEDHAERAVRMALEMRLRLDRLCEELSQAALAEVNAGIGITTGYVTVGNFGSPNRMEYTVIGNHVNLASRLADDAAPGEVLISERTLALLPLNLVEVERAGERKLKGVQRPVRLYRITSPLDIPPSGDSEGGG